MNDHQLQVLLDEVSGVPALADRRDAVRQRVRTRRRRHTVIAATAATVAVGLLGTLTIEHAGSRRTETSLSSAPIVGQRTAGGGDVVAVRSLGDGRLFINTGGIQAEASDTDRAVAPYAVLDTPATSSVSVTGSTLTKDQHGRPIIVVVVHANGDGVSRVRASLPDSPTAISDEATPTQRVAVLVLRPANEDESIPTVRIESIGIDSATSSTLDIEPFTQRPWSCNTNTQLAEAQTPSPLVAIPTSPSDTKPPSASSALIAPPLRAPCPGD